MGANGVEALAGELGLPLSGTPKGQGWWGTGGQQGPRGKARGSGLTPQGNSMPLQGGSPRGQDAHQTSGEASDHSRRSQPCVQTTTPDRSSGQPL